MNLLIKEYTVFSQYLVSAGILLEMIQKQMQIKSECWLLAFSSLWCKHSTYSDWTMRVASCHTVSPSLKTCYPKVSPGHLGRDETSAQHSDELMNWGCQKAPSAPIIPTSMGSQWEFSSYLCSCGPVTVFLTKWWEMRLEKKNRKRSPITH